jgi:hypothetical protein
VLSSRIVQFSEDSSRVRPYADTPRPRWLWLRLRRAKSLREILLAPLRETPLASCVRALIRSSFHAHADHLERFLKLLAHRQVQRLAAGQFPHEPFFVEIFQLARLG